MTTITEVEECGGGMLIVTTRSGESFDLTEDAFVALTGREWEDIK